MGLVQGQTVGQVWKQIEVSEQTYDRWRKESGGHCQKNPFRYFKTSPEIIRRHYKAHLSDSIPFLLTVPLYW